MKKELLQTLFKKITNGGFIVKYWDGEEVNYGDCEPTVKIIFHKPLPLSFNLEDPMLQLGEAYMDEIFDIEGGMEEVMRIIQANKEEFVHKESSKTLGSALKTLNNATKKLTQRENIQHHYDLGNDFFALWLDQSMSYSCGYFKNPRDTLYQAQMQKIDHILKKLQLKPGEKLLDIGSGWGHLIIKAAQEYGVHATGVTLSEEQYKATLEKIEELGLTDQVEVKLQDYLDLDEQVQFDKIVSVGMFEHVGKGNLSKYMDKVERLLKPGGLSMLHSIMGTDEAEVNAWVTTYIFPGGYIPSLRETIWLLPQFDFHLIHAESLRLHYAMTLDRWHSNYLKHWDTVEKKFGRRFARMWSLYLEGCAASFRVSGLNIYQLLFSKGLNNDLKLTLDHVY